MKTFHLSLLWGGMLLLCFSCTPEESILLGTQYEKQANLPAAKIFTIPDLFIPADEFRGKNAEEIRSDIERYNSMIDDPSLDEWRMCDPGYQAYSVYLETDPQSVLVVQGQIGPTVIEGEDDIWINCVYLTGETSDVAVYPDIQSARFMDPGKENIALDMELVVERAGAVSELEWFGEKFPLNQFETRLKINFPVARPTEKEFFPGLASILISGAIPVEVSPSDTE